MENRRGRGSQTTIPRRKRKKGPTRKEAARIRVVERLGEEAIKQIQEDWASWDTGYGGKEWQQSEGVVLHLLQQGFSEREIRAVVLVGGSRIARLRNELTTGVDAMHTRRDRPKPWHAFSEQDIEAFKLHCSTWILENGFPCAHRRPRQYFTEPGLTWLEVHARYEYEIKRTNPDARTLSYSRFTQYVHYHFPGVRLTRTAEDLCDCCVQLDIQLQEPDLSDEQKQTLLLEKRTHLNEAIAQRRFVSSSIKDYTSLHAPAQTLPLEIIPDTIDAATTPNEDDVTEGNEVEPGAAPSSCRVQIQAEDFGGGICMPFYGHSRPSADYFNSNLILQNFAVADITNNQNNVYLYDERAQGKDANALCSLRLLYHLTTIQKDAANGIPVAEITFSLLDNCVGQIKSKVVMMFFAMLSVIFPYKKVVLCFLLPGHSHNIADRVVAWCRNAVRGSNIYTPSLLVDEINKVKSVNSIFLDHNEPTHPFYIEWEAMLGKYFIPPPAGYTSKYLFEIDEGVCTARKNVDTPDKDAITFDMINPRNITSIRKAVIRELFGPAVQSIWEASARRVQLPRHATKVLSEKKMKSLSAKYFSILQQYLSYYPSVPDSVVNAPASASTLEPTAAGATSSKQKRRPGRPKQGKKAKTNQPSILQFFSAVDDQRTSSGRSAEGV